MYTYELAVNDAGAPEELTAQTSCSRVTFYEKPTEAGWPRLWQYREKAADDPAVVAQGGSKIFMPGLSTKRPVYSPDELIALVETVTGEGATVFIVVEE